MVDRLHGILNKMIALSYIAIIYELLHLVELFGLIQIPYVVTMLLEVPYILLLFGVVAYKFLHNPAVDTQFKVILGLTIIRLIVNSTLGTAPFIFNLIDRVVCTIALVLAIEGFHNIIEYIDYLHHHDKLK